MNKASYVAMIFALIVPSMMFASSDSLSSGGSNAGSSSQDSSTSAGKVSVQDITIMGECTNSMESDTANKDCAKGQHIKDAVLTKRSIGSGTMMGSGMNQESKGLMLAIGTLSPTDRETLLKMIKDYLVSKGIDPAKYAEKRDEIREIRQEGREEIRDIKKSRNDAMKMKREEMKEKVQQIKTGWDLKKNVKV